MNQTESVLLEIVKQSCFPHLVDYSYINHSIDWAAVYELCQKHFIQCLVFQTVQHMDIPAEIKHKWEADTYKQLIKNLQVAHVERKVIEQLYNASIPAVILKGSSAAQYYTRPECRAVGDIDLITKPEDYEKACILLDNIGCINITTDQEKQQGRHRCYHLKNVEIELHKSFSVLPDHVMASRMDEQLFSDIHEGTRYLSQSLNGLVLLEHIYQHLETGIGLRQIIDWMMFVHRCLKDDQWENEFKKIASTYGLEIFAQTVTKMCQLFLGLEYEEITWCDAAEIDVCEQLFDYILESGNFGINRGFLQTNEITQYPSSKSVLSIIRYLQEIGKKKWLVTNKIFLLRPFAWIFQGVHSIKKLIQNSANIQTLYDAYEEGLRRKQLFKRLGIKQRIE